MILDFSIIPRGGHEMAFHEKTLKLIDKEGAIPGEIRVKMEEAYSILTPLARSLGINLHLVHDLPMQREAAEEMKNQFVL